jgi:hypothetical protein
MANVSEPIALTVAEDGVVKTGALSPKRVTFSHKYERAPALQFD